MKKLFCLFFALLMLASATPFVSAAETLSGQEAAENLHALGLLAGVGKNADGSVNFDVDGKLTRAQAITQIVRFLGAEKTATASAYTHPFTDLPAWAVPYVGYAFENGITKGVSATKFGTDDRMGDAAFLTLILRVLGYKDAEGDFVWNNPYTLAKTAGLIDSETSDGEFTRGDAFVICYRAITATVKSGASIKEQLIGKGVFTAETFDKVAGTEVADVPTAPADAKMYTIKDLNLVASEGSHVNDDFKTANVELNFREVVDLNSAKTGYTRYDNAYYPRIKKIRDDLYILFFMGGQTGPHLYWTLSHDGVNWDEPEVLHNSNLPEKNIVHEDGPLAGKKDRLMGCNVDALVLPNGEILAVYYERPSDGYDEFYPPYMDMNGVFLVRGTVDENDKVVWGEHKKIYTGTGWEPFIFRTEDGTLQVVWSANAEYHSMYGMDTLRRSTYIMMVESYDNGYTWTPEVKEGDQNHYVATRIFKEFICDRVPEVKNDPVITTPVKYWAGQMPAMVRLVDGRTLLAVESKREDLSFDISFGYSDENGKWTPLGFEEEGPTEMLHALFDGAGPYLARFPSGEVYLTYHWGKLRYRIGSPDGTQWSDRYTALPGGSNEMWGASELNGSHEVISVFPPMYGDKRGVQIGHSYLNHRTNAKPMTPTVDGLVGDWAANTDALFVGSETQAQITQQVAHDAENVYFLINRLDTYLTDGDTVTVNIGVGAMQSYRVIVGLDGIRTIAYVEAGVEKQQLTGGTAAIKVYGTPNNNEDKDEGVVYEIAIPKALVGLTDATSFKACPALDNQDGVGSISDTLTGVSPFLTAAWPEVKLD